MITRKQSQAMGCSYENEIVLASPSICARASLGIGICGSVCPKSISLFVSFWIFTARRVFGLMRPHKKCRRGENLFFAHSSAGIETERFAMIILYQGNTSWNIQELKRLVSMTSELLMLGLIITCGAAKTSIGAPTWGVQDFTSPRPTPRTKINSDRLKPFVPKRL
jgi:hypothetical protein